MRNSGASVTFHILDEASYKQAKAQGVNLSKPQSAPVANGVTKQAPKPKLCYLVKSSSEYGFSLRSVKGELGRQALKNHDVDKTTKHKLSNTNTPTYNERVEFAGLANRAPFIKVYKLEIIA